MDLPIPTLPQGAPQPATQSTSQSATAAPAKNAQDGGVKAETFSEILAAGLVGAVASLAETAPETGQAPGDAKPKNGAPKADDPDSVTLLFAVIGMPQTVTTTPSPGKNDQDEPTVDAPTLSAAADSTAKPTPLQAAGTPPRGAENAQAQTPFSSLDRADEHDESAKTPSEASLAAAPILPAAAHAVPPPPPQASHLQAATAAVAEIRTPVHAPEWGGDLGKTVMWMAQGEKSSAEIHLNPPDLGPVSIKLTLNAGDSGQASVAFASPHSAVRDAIESAIPQLRDMLAGSGITLGQATVTADSFRQPGNEASSDGEPTAQDVERIDGTATAPTIRTGVGLVDIFA